MALSSEEGAGTGAQLAPGPSPGFSSRGGPTTRWRGQKPEGGVTFSNTVLDV